MHMIRIVHLTWAVGWVLAGAAAAAEPELVRLRATPTSAPATETSQAAHAAGADDNVIQLFGSQSPASSVRLTAASEGEREITRREPPPNLSRAGGAGESRPIRNPVKATGTWSLSDLLPLSIVLGLIAAIALAVRRFMPARAMMMNNAAGVLEVVARTAVGPRQSVVMVRVAKRFLLLGVSADRITTLCIVDDAQSSAELMTEVASRRPGSSTQAFQNAFSEEASEFDDEEVDPTRSATGHVRGLLEKVRQMKRGRVA